MPHTPSSPALTLGDVAKRLGVSPESVRRWAKTGKLRSWRTPGGHRRFFLADVEAFLAAGISEPEAEAV